MKAFTAILATSLVLASSSLTFAHSGPPFPIVTDAVHGPYTISIWTDPDATDDGTPGGQFWIVIEASTQGRTVPPDTRATVSIQGLERQGAALRASAAPVRGDITNQFAALVMDHEGPYAVHVGLSGSLGEASIESKVDATYDLRPPPYMLIWYLMPFLLVGFLWSRLLLRRRKLPGRRSDRVHLP